MRRLVIAAAVAASVLPFTAVSAADDSGPGSGGSYVHWVGEFEPGADLEHYADWVLDKLDVPAEDQAARKPDGYLFTELDMVWLYLTQSEADQASALIGQAPLMNAETTGVVELPTPVGTTLRPENDIGGPAAAPGQMGWEETPVGYNRIGVPVDRPPANGVRVAVVDTGIDGRHSDLEGRIAGGFNCSQDHRGPDGYDIDEHGHGTWIGGLIDANRNDSYIGGIASGSALLSEVTFGAAGSASGAMVLCAVNKALEHGADIISASLGGGEIASRCGGPSVYTNGWCKAARRAIVVVAAGNDAVDAINFAPANVPGVVTVGALVDFDGLPGEQSRGFVGCGLTHRDDYLAVFSDWGSIVDFVAPGACEVSLAPAQSWQVMSGTSMATPYVAAVFAAFLSQFPDCRGEDAIRTVRNYAERYADEHPEEGYGGWPGAEAPPIIRYVDEQPLQRQDPENPKPCAFEEQS